MQSGGICVVGMVSYCGTNIRLRACAGEEYLQSRQPEVPRRKRDESHSGTEYWKVEHMDYLHCG